MIPLWACVRVKVETGTFAAGWLAILAKSMSFSSVRDHVSKDKVESSWRRHLILISGFHRHIHTRAQTLAQWTRSTITSVSELWALKGISASKNSDVVTEVELLLAVAGRESEHP